MADQLEQLLAKIPKIPLNELTQAITQVQEEYRLDPPLRVAVTGTPKVDVLNGLVKDYLFPSLPNHIVVELHYYVWPKICWYCGEHNQLQLEEVLHLDDCVNWKVLRRAAYLKTTLRQVETKSATKQNLKKVEVHYPFANPFPQKVILTTDADIQPADVVFTSSVTKLDGTDVISLTGTTGTCQAVQPHKALLNYLSNTESENSRYFDHVVKHMMCKAVRRAEDVRKQEAQRLMERCQTVTASLCEHQTSLGKLISHLQQCLDDMAQPRGSINELTREPSTPTTTGGPGNTKTSNLVSPTANRSTEPASPTSKRSVSLSSPTSRNSGAQPAHASAPDRSPTSPLVRSPSNDRTRVERTPPSNKLERSSSTTNDRPTSTISRTTSNTAERVVSRVSSSQLASTSTFPSSSTATMWQGTHSTWEPPAPTWEPKSSSWLPKAPEVPTVVTEMNFWHPSEPEWQPHDSTWRPHPGSWQPHPPRISPKQEWAPHTETWAPQPATWKPGPEWQPTAVNAMTA